jgi:excisionase family DNA binding protein
VPGPLCVPLAKLAIIGARTLSDRDGGALVLEHGVASVLAALATAASGGQVRTVASSHPAWISVREASEITGYSARWLREIAHGGQVIARRAGRDWLLDRQAVEDYAKGRKVA